MPHAPLVEQGFLEKLERLTLHWQKSFPGLVGGHNPSRFTGPGLEFLDHRHFHLGDDLRAVNWRAYLRLEKLFLKMFQTEPRIPVRMLVDTSASMTTGAIPKFEYARKLAAALCYVGLVRLETVAIQPFAGKLGDRFLCGGGRHRFAPAVEYLTRLAPGGGTNYFQVAREFLTRYLQRGLLIIISDFLDEAGCEKPLQYLADFGHELLLIHLWAEEDRTPPWSGELELVDAESGASLEIQFDQDAAAGYREAFDRFADALRSLALRNNGRYAGLSTSLPLEEAVFGPLAQARGIG